MDNKLKWSIQQGTIELPVYVVGEPLDTIIDSIRETNAKIDVTNEQIEQTNTHLETVHLKQENQIALLENLVSLQQTQIGHFETLLTHQQTIIDNQGSQQQELTSLNETSNNIYEKLMRVYPESTGYELEPNPIEVLVGESVTVIAYETFSDGTRTELETPQLSMEENEFATLDQNTVTGIEEGETTVHLLAEDGEGLTSVQVIVSRETEPPEEGEE